jgi:hypothetical protein
MVMVCSNADKMLMSWFSMHFLKLLVVDNGMNSSIDRFLLLLVSDSCVRILNLDLEFNFN